MLEKVDCDILRREDLLNRHCSFFNIVQKAVDPPALRFEHYVANFFEGLLKKRGMGGPGDSFFVVIVVFIVIVFVVVVVLFVVFVVVLIETDMWCGD